MKKSKLNYENSVKTIEKMMPEDLKATALPALEACKNSVNGIKDACEAAYAFVKCLYENDPQYSLVP